MNQIYNIKFTNIDLLAAMGSVVEAHTQFYKSDFDIDKKALTNATITPIQQDKNFIWLCRTMGTWCLRERDVFLTDTHEHNTLCFYQEQSHEPILAYAVKVKYQSMGSVIGNLYAMNYDKLYDHVKAVSLRSASVLMRYERGEIVKPVSQFNGGYDCEFGKLKDYQFFPEDEDALRTLLRNEKRNRELFTEGDFNAYIATLL